MEKGGGGRRLGGDEDVSDWSGTRGAGMRRRVVCVVEVGMDMSDAPLS